MIYIYVFLGMFVSIIALIRRELLIKQPSFKIILSVSLVLFVAGVVLRFSEFGRQSASSALLVPLLSLGLFRGLRKVFVGRFLHEPRDTYFNWSSGLGWDRAFNIIYFSLSFWLFLLIVFVMEELGKAGW